MKLLQNYVRVEYKITSLLRDYAYNKSVLEGWQERLNEITEISAVSYEGVGGNGGISDRTFNVANERANIEHNVDEYKTDLIAIQKAINSLPEREKEIIMGIVNGIPSDRVMAKLHIEKSRYAELCKNAKDKLILQLWG